jgi:hypothetical protein
VYLNEDAASTELAMSFELLLDCVQPLNRDGKARVPIECPYDAARVIACPLHQIAKMTNELVR